MADGGENGGKRDLEQTKETGDATGADTEMKAQNDDGLGFRV
jgi:hypothetical protein